MNSTSACIYIYSELLLCSVLFSLLLFEAKTQKPEDEQEDPEDDATHLMEAAAEKMIAAMSIQGFSPVDFPNPALVFHNRVLEVE